MRILEKFGFKIKIAEMTRFTRNVQWDLKIVNLKSDFGYMELHSDSTRPGQEEYTAIIGSSRGLDLITVRRVY